MKEIVDEILRRSNAGERLALCVVVKTKGSTPQGAGAKMLLLSNGQQLGTLGGGCVEAEVKTKAMQLLLAGESKSFTFRLDHDYGWDDGLICGGVMEIAVQTVLPGNLAAFEELSKQLARNQSAMFSMTYEIEGEAKTYSEELGPTPTLLIVGAGHVGQSLGEMASKLDFHLDVIDDRGEYVSPARFPTARNRIIGEVDSELARYPIDASTYVVIVTRGHRHDGRALEAALQSDAKYIGLIGSRAKIKVIFADLVSRGISIEKLLKVHAPIGLEIGAITVPEIAVSIAAELVAVRRGRGGQSARAMKFSEGEMRTWLETKS